MTTIEFRRYATHPGKRDDLMELFEREFIESQEACGMVPVGQYRDLDDPDSFVWFRSFPQFEGRRESLEAFYLQSDVWKAHRNAANATLVDSDNVLLLRPAREETGFDLSGLRRRPSGEQPAASYVAVSIFTLDAPADAEYIASFEDKVLPQLAQTARRIAYFVTEERANDFPGLPVREGIHVFLVAGICPNVDALDRWSDIAGNARCETLRLEAGGRALFRM